MARIRSIKPEFWTDPDVIALSMAARLFFVGCWNFADDYGVLGDEPARLKFQIMPGDDVDAAALVEELVSLRHLVRMVTPDGTNVLVVRTFLTHQKIDKRAVGRWGKPQDFTPTDPFSPLPDDPHQSPPIPTDSTPGREGKGREMEGSGENGKPTSSNVKLVFDRWVEVTGRDVPRTKLNDKRRKLIKRSLDDYGLDDTLKAIEGWQYSEYHNGVKDGKIWNDLELLLRDSSKIEQFIGFCEQAKASNPTNNGTKSPANQLKELARCENCSGNVTFHNFETDRVEVCAVCRGTGKADVELALKLQVAAKSQKT